jgi:predicted transcriptional regulator
MEARESHNNNKPEENVGGSPKKSKSQVDLFQSGIKFEMSRISEQNDKIEQIITSSFEKQKFKEVISDLIKKGYEDTKFSEIISAQLVSNIESVKFSKIISESVNKENETQTKIVIQNTKRKWKHDILIGMAASLFFALLLLAMSSIQNTQGNSLDPILKSCSSKK